MKIGKKAFSLPLLGTLFAAVLLFAAPATFAVTECRVTPGTVFVGGDPAGTGSNYFWASWAEGGASVVYQNDPNYKPLLALLMTAKTAQRTVVVRYQADNVNCTAQNPGTVLGMWLQ